MSKTIKVMPSFLLGIMDYASKNIMSEAEVEKLMGKIESMSGMVLTNKSISKLAIDTAIAPNPNADTDLKTNPDGMIEVSDSMIQDETGVVRQPPLSMPKAVVKTPEELVQLMSAIMESKNYQVPGRYVLKILYNLIHEMGSEKEVSSDMVANLMQIGAGSERGRARKPVSELPPKETTGEELNPIIQRSPGGQILDRHLELDVDSEGMTELMNAKAPEGDEVFAPTKEKTSNERFPVKK